MSTSELRTMISDLCPSIGFTMVPTLEDNSGWTLNAFTDIANVVKVWYYHMPVVKDVHFRVVSEVQHADLLILNASDVAHKVVELLTTQTLN